MPAPSRPSGCGRRRSDRGRRREMPTLSSLGGATAPTLADMGVLRTDDELRALAQTGKISFRDFLVAWAARDQLPNIPVRSEAWQAAVAGWPQGAQIEDRRVGWRTPYREALGEQAYVADAGLAFRN